MFKQLYRLIILLYECQILTNLSVKNELLLKKNQTKPTEFLVALDSFELPVLLRMTLSL